MYTEAENMNMKDTAMAQADETHDGDYECVCDKCRGRFAEKDLVTIQYAEYPGASMQDTYASPCCHAAWEYTGEE